MSPVNKFTSLAVGKLVLVQGNFYYRSTLVHNEIIVLFILVDETLLNIITITYVSISCVTI